MQGGRREDRRAVWTHRERCWVSAAVDGLGPWSADVDDTRPTHGVVCPYPPSTDARCHGAPPVLTAGHVCCRTATPASCATCTIYTGRHMKKDVVVVVVVVLRGV